MEGSTMQIGEAVAVTMITDVEDECPFDHELEEPPEVKNELVGKGSQLATNMNNGTSTNSYAPFTPDKASNKRGKLPQKDPNHQFHRGRDDKGRCLTIEFNDGTSKNYPVSCSAHHLVPSQESLKDHDLLQYMCKKGSSGDHNHGFSAGKVWSDAGYNTNGSENGVYLPGSYAVGGGRGGLIVWYPLGADEDKEHDTDYIEVDKLPPSEYQDFLISGEKGKIKHDNACWHYVSKAMKLAPGQFHDRHVKYSEEVVVEALNNIFKMYKKYDILENPSSCDQCEKKRKDIEEKGIPTPYTVVKRLEFVSSKLRGYLNASAGSWKRNVFTSEWVNAYMKEVIRQGNTQAAADAINI